eukprot:4399469-Pleurochrysis_carterae.AAC.1
MKNKACGTGGAASKDACSARACAGLGHSAPSSCSAGRRYTAAPHCAALHEAESCLRWSIQRDFWRQNLLPRAFTIFTHIS